jgi:hypothetical protein
MLKRLEKVEKDLNILWGKGLKNLKMPIPRTKMKIFKKKFHLTLLKNSLEHFFWEGIEKT